MTTPAALDPRAILVGSTFEHVEAQAIALGPVADRSPVVGRLYYSARRYGYAIRYQVRAEAVTLVSGERFVPGR